MRLLQVFKDFEVRLVGKSCRSRYDAEYKLEPKPNPKKVTLDDVKAYVEDLQKRYPEKNFYLGFKTINGKTYCIITRKKRIRTREGLVKYVSDRIPIYIDLEEQKFYVPQRYVKKQYKLTCYILMRTLGKLGVARVKYIGMLR